MSHKSRSRVSLASSRSGGHLVEVATREKGRRGQLAPGAMVGGRFRVERRIGSGAMGEVWLGTHRELQLPVAIKTLRDEVRGNPEVVARFSREAFLLGRIQSDHVVRVIDFVTDAGRGPALVTEYVEGVSLHAILASRRYSVEEAVGLAIDLVTGLRDLHRAHIVHRDVKPANVLMRRITEHERRAVFLDLGVSRLLTDDGVDESDCLTEITCGDRAVGTYEYMAPEQILNSRAVTPSADLYAVGSILFRAVSGRHVFGELTGVDLLKTKLNVPAPPLETGRGDPVSSGFSALVGRALAQAPADRYECADEMLTDLSFLRDAARHAVRRTGASGSVRKPNFEASLGTTAGTSGARRARRWLLGASWAATMLALGGVGGGAMERFVLEPPARPDVASLPAVPPAAVPPVLQLHAGADRCTLEPAPQLDVSSGRTTYAIVCADPVVALP